MPPPSAAIDGVPTQFDEFVACATARDPADRYADAIEMGADLDAIAEELALPDFRVPAPRNSAQHRSAALHHSQVSQHGPRGAAARRQSTGSSPHPPVDPRPRRLVRAGTTGPPESEPESGPDEYEYEPVPGQFAGIAMEEFVWARQHARRMVLIWVAIVLAVTGLVATAAWTIGSNLSGLLRGSP